MNRALDSTDQTEVHSTATQGDVPELCVTALQSSIHDCYLPYASQEPESLYTDEAFPCVNVPVTMAWVTVAFRHFKCLCGSEPKSFQGKIKIGHPPTPPQKKL